MKVELIEKLLEMLISGSIEKSKDQEGDFSEHYGKYVIVRSADSGVHYGLLKSINGRTVELTKSRRMWRWWAKKQMTLSAVAEFGLNEDKDLRIQNEISNQIIMGSCEVIPCYQECINSFNRVKPYDEQ